jgi:hypothetical protein
VYFTMLTVSDCTALNGRMINESVGTDSEGSGSGVNRSTDQNLMNGISKTKKT